MDLALLAAELKRRRVIRAVIVWGVVAFAVLQIYEAVMHGLHLPEWTLSFVVVILGIGFPITVALAWAFDLTARGVERSPTADGADFKHPRFALVLLGFGLLAAAPGIAWHFLRHPGEETSKAPPVAADGPSIAVLSFADMSPAHDQEYFADGVAEEILNALASVEGLRVPGRTSSFYFKAKSAKLSEIGRELGVTNVLEGSVRKDGNRVRVTAQLVRIKDETHLWSKTYDRELKGIFVVQEEVAKDVVNVLRMRLSGQTAVVTAVPNTADSYGEYLLARHLFFALRPDLALPHLERTVAVDRDYAPAWALLSVTVAQLAVNAGVATLDDRQRALTAAEKAIALAPEESVGYVARAFTRNFLLWDWSGARADAERALALKKSYLNPYNQNGLALARIGRMSEAISFGKKATEVDPLNIVYWGNLAWFYTAAGELEAARTAVGRIRDISPDNKGIAYRLGLVDLLRGSASTALAQFEDSKALDGIAMARHDLGDASRSQDALHALSTAHAVDAPYSIARVHAWRGESDLAFEWLQRAYDRRDLDLSDVKADPLLRKLHGDTRYTAFLKKMNLPVD